MPFRTRVLGGISIYTDNCFPKQLFSPELYIARTINFSKMNIGKFTSLYDLLEAFPTEESCIKYLEQQRWANGIPVSPYDPYVQSMAMECTAIRIRARTSTSEQELCLKALIILPLSKFNLGSLLCGFLYFLNPALFLVTPIIYLETMP